MGAKVPLVVAQANEANSAADETLAKAAPLYALKVVFSRAGEEKSGENTKTYRP